MHLIGRYLRVREFGPGGWGQPYMIDYRLQKMMPFTNTDEWFRTNDGLWVPAIRGGSGFAGNMVSSVVRIPWMVDGVSIGTLVQRLDSSYTAGSAGKAIGAKGVLRTTKTISKVLVYSVNAFSGGAPDIDFELRADDAATGRPDVSGAALATGSIGPVNANGWWQFTSFGGDLTVIGGTPYHYIIGDANGAAVSTNDILGWSRHSFSFQGTGVPWLGIWGAESTSNGWLSLSHDGTASVIVVFDDGTVIGNVLVRELSGTNNALQKGLRFATGFAEKLKIAGAWLNNTSTTMTGMNLWRGTTGPGGSVESGDAATIIPSAPGLTTKNGALFSSPRSLGKTEDFRLVCAFSGASNKPNVFTIGDLVTALASDVRKALFARGDWHATEEVAGPTWQDNLDGMPGMALYVEDQEEIVIAGGGGGGGGPVIRTRPARG